MRFERINPADADWERLDAFDDRIVSQRQAWLSFLVESQRGESVMGRLIDCGETVGFLSGLVVRRFGIRMFGSPLDGWSTPFMGFNLAQGVSRCEALRAAEDFAFRELGCAHMELRDRFLTSDDGNTLGFEKRTRRSFISDLSQDEDALFGNMGSACRRNVRAAERNGLRVEEAEPAGFAEHYYDQLLDVFAKQNLKPTYTVERVRSLIKHVYPSGSLLLLRVVRPDGKVVATGIYPGYLEWCLFWGNASYRGDQHLRPNELLHWEAMRRWKSRGAVTFDWGGGGDYKKKYGVQEVENPHFFKSAHPVLQLMRSRAFAAYHGARKLRQRIVRRP